MFGVLNIFKQAGVTSRYVVNRVQQCVRRERVGHAGTLDPMATGVLVIVLGRATRLVEFIHQLPKRYVASFRFGQVSDTEDVTGNIEQLVSAPEPSLNDLESVASRFLGDIVQIPPAFSAVKVSGQRAYKRARRGQDVELPARTVSIHELRIVSYNYPDLTLDISCGSGTYIRSIGRDIATALNTGAVMTSLERCSIGDFLAADAISLADLSRQTLPSKLLPAVNAVSRFAKRQVTSEEADRLSKGLPISQQEVDASLSQIAACDETGELVAILNARGDGLLRPVRTFFV